MIRVIVPAVASMPRGARTRLTNYLDTAELNPFQTAGSGLDSRHSFGVSHSEANRHTPAPAYSFLINALEENLPGLRRWDSRKSVFSTVLRFFSF
jgi:hypothetical protein